MLFNSIEYLIFIFYSFIEIEILIDSIALTKKIKVIGSFDPESNNLENLDYYDGMHLKPTGIKKLFN